MPQCSQTGAKAWIAHSKLRDPQWLHKLGMEKVGTLMTRGVLIDIAGLKGVDILPINYEITVADLEQALQKQGLSLQPGDAVLIYTGWSKPGVSTISFT